MSLPRASGPSGREYLLFALQVPILFLLAGGSTACAAIALQAHYTFDDASDLGLDSSSNGRHADTDGLDGAGWVNDPERGGVVEFLGADDGFLRAAVPQLPASGFTITLWAYRDSNLAGMGSGANDGLFQFQLGGATPVLEMSDKVIGGWARKTDSAVWGRIVESDGDMVNLDTTTYFMSDGNWTHLAYRADGTTFELLVNAQSGVGPSTSYDGTLDLHDTLFIGKQGDIESWGGRIDDFRVYSRALSDEEIALVMAGNVIPEPAALVVWVILASAVLVAPWRRRRSRLA